RGGTWSCCSASRDGNWKYREDPHREICNSWLGRPMNGNPSFGQTGPRTYIDPGGRFSLQVPPGWLVDNSGQQGSLVILFHPTVKRGSGRTSTCCSSPSPR